MAFGEQQQGDKIFPPKIGADPIVIKPVEMNRVEVDPEDGYKTKEKKFGYRDEIKLEDGKTLICNVWKLYFALQEYPKVIFGSSLKISHPSHGEYKVEAFDPTNVGTWDD